MDSVTDSNVNQLSSQATVSEIVTFLFPRNELRALYALACVQSFVARYVALERISIWSQNPDAARRLIVHVRCDPRFYTLYRKQFPANCIYVSSDLNYGPDGPDEMLVDLTDKRLDTFPAVPGYSTQWLMGLLAGTMPKMLPSLSVVAYQTCAVIDVHLAQGLSMFSANGMFSAGAFKDLCRHYVSTQNLSVNDAHEFAQDAAIVIAPESALTVLALAMGKRVVEITRTASQSPFGPMQNYVQVSALQPDTFFQDALKRGVEWVCRASISPSTATNADVKSEPSPLSAA